MHSANGCVASGRLRNISLDEIAATTKIGTRLLRALEDEQFDQLPGGIFNKGYVRAYAKYVGIDEEQAVADYLQAANRSFLPTCMSTAEQHCPSRFDRFRQRAIRCPEAIHISRRSRTNRSRADCGSRGWLAHLPRASTRSAAAIAKASSETLKRSGPAFRRAAFPLHPYPPLNPVMARRRMARWPGKPVANTRRGHKLPRRVGTLLVAPVRMASPGTLPAKNSNQQVTV